MSCPCREGTCNAGLVCTDNRCQAPAVVPPGLVVSDPAARACEVLLGGASEHVKVSVDASIAGKSIHDGDRLALAFHSTGDGAIPAGSVSVAGRAGEPGDLSSLRVAASRCFDRDGAELSGAAVTLHTTDQ